MPINSETTVSEPPAELSKINETLSPPALGNKKISEIEIQRVTGEEKDIRDKIVDAIELPEANGFTVLVS